MILDKVISVAKTPSGWMAAVGAYFIPLQGVFELVIAIVLIDLLTGIWASRIRKVPISSHRLRKSVSKFVGYLLTIWLFYKFETEVGIQEWLCTYKLVTGFIFITEVISILENLAVITGNKVFTKIIRLIRGKAKKDEKTGSLIEDILDEKNK